MSFSQASPQSARSNGVEAQADGPHATFQTFYQPVTSGSVSQNNGSSSSTRFGDPSRAQSYSAAPSSSRNAATPHGGILEMSRRPRDDPTYRLVQDCADAAAIVTMNMATRTQKLLDQFEQEYEAQNEAWRNTMEVKLEEAIVKYYGFIESSMAVESLKEPGKREFKRLKKFWPGIKAEGFKPSEHKFHWKRLCTIPGHSKVAREALDSSPSWFMEYLNMFARVDSDDDRDVYDSERLTTVVAATLISVAVLLCSVPTILLAMEAVSSKGGRVSLIVCSDLLLGVVLIWTGVEVGFSVAITMAYSAVLVNVDV